MRILIALAALALCASASAAEPQPGTANFSPRIIAACGTELNSEGALRRLPPRAREQKLACLLREIARDLNQELPQTEDDVTFEKVSVAGMELTYRQTLHGDARNPDPARAAAVGEAIRTGLCSKSYFRSITSMGAAFNVRVHDENGRLLSETRISRC